MDRARINALRNEPGRRRAPGRSALRAGEQLPDSLLRLHQLPLEPHPAVIRHDAFVQPVHLHEVLMQYGVVALGHRSAQHAIQRVEAQRPAATEARGSRTIVVRRGQLQRAPVRRRVQLPAQHLDAPGVLEHLRRFVRADHAAGLDVDGRARIRLEGEGDRTVQPQVELDRGREPSGQLSGLGDRPPDLLHRMPQLPPHPQNRPAVLGAQGLGHDSIYTRPGIYDQPANRARSASSPARSVRAPASNSS